ncbi:uncharacterized protein LOC143350706 [Colletes latitarsis]|uniref:uncharacterized protein LOC143350706 n=1 Tax=Colletes latitarsis TaxID=2605962 RepID=UPI0040355E3C
MAALGRIMPNVGGPGHKTSLLFYYVLESILLYAAPIWARWTSVGANLKRLENAQSLGLIRVTKAYRTVARIVLPVIAGVIPIALKIKERGRILQAEEEVREMLGADHQDLHATILAERKRVREETLEEWQDAWDQEGREKLTYRWIPNIEAWLKRPVGQSELCWYGCAVADTAEHTITRCKKWMGQRERLREELQLEEEISIEDLGTRMIQGHDQWSAILSFITEIMIGKAATEREMDREARRRRTRT